MLAHVGKIPALRNKSYSAGIIDAHPCKKRKDGAPSVEMLHIEMVKCGPPFKERKDGAPSVRMMYTRVVEGGHQPRRNWSLK